VNISAIQRNGQTLYRVRSGPFATTEMPTPRWRDFWVSVLPTPTSSSSHRPFCQFVLSRFPAENRFPLFLKTLGEFLHAAIAHPVRRVAVLGLVAAPASAVMSTSAEHALLMDGETGQVLWAKDALRRCRQLRCRN